MSFNTVESKKSGHAPNGEHVMDGRVRNAVYLPIETSLCQVWTKKYSEIFSRLDYKDKMRMTSILKMRTYI